MTGTAGIPWFIEWMEDPPLCVKQSGFFLTPLEKVNKTLNLLSTGKGKKEQALQRRIH